MSSFEKLYKDPKPAGWPSDYDIAKKHYVAGLLRAAEICGNEDCDQEEYRCMAIDRAVQSIESEAQKIEKGE